jgi:hypothetical protein
MNFFELTGCLILLLIIEDIWDATDYLYKQTAKKIYGIITHSSQLVMFGAIGLFSMWLGYACRFGTGHFNWSAFAYVIIGYVLLRIAIFNAVYNLLTKRPILSLGTSNIYDNILNLITKILGIKDIRVFETGYSLIIMLSLFFGCSFLIDALNRL